MLHHLAGATIQLANLVNYNCRPQEDGNIIIKPTVTDLKFRTLFSFCFSIKFLLIRAGIHKMLVQRANREDPYQIASSEAVRSGSVLFLKQLAFEIS